MCVYSMIIDHFDQKWNEKYNEWLNKPYTQPLPNDAPPMITEEELKEFRKLLERAREYDKKNNQPDCELEEKKEMLRKLAEQLGVKIEFV